MATDQVGDVVFRHEQPGATRSAIARFSEATEDPNPIHVDRAYAEGSGFPDVIAQGPMTTAHFARLLARTFGATRLRVLDLTFTAPVFPDEPLVLTATVGKVDGELTLDLVSTKLDGTVTAKGFAQIAARGATA
jgi:acyl dehydratase